MLCEELRELLDTAIIKAKLNRTEILMLEKRLLKVVFVDDFLANVYENSDELDSFSARQYSFIYINHYIKKDELKAKTLRAKELLKKQETREDELLVKMAKSIYSNENEQIAYIKNYL